MALKRLQFNETITEKIKKENLPVEQITLWLLFHMYSAVLSNRYVPHPRGLCVWHSDQKEHLPPQCPAQPTLTCRLSTSGYTRKELAVEQVGCLIRFLLGDGGLILTWVHYPAGLGNKLRPFSYLLWSGLLPSAHLLCNLIQYVKFV